MDTHHRIVNGESHPTWVRGLKQQTLVQNHRHTKVAPYVGAWIETLDMFLKDRREDSRTLRGCVD